jgi:hypothetical protein
MLVACAGLLQDFHLWAGVLHVKDCCKIFTCQLACCMWRIVMRSSPVNWHVACEGLLWDFHLSTGYIVLISLRQWEFLFSCRSAWSDFKMALIRVRQIPSLNLDGSSSRHCKLMMLHIHCKPAVCHSVCLLAFLPGRSSHPSCRDRIPEST